MKSVMKGVCLGLVMVCAANSHAGGEEERMLDEKLRAAFADGELPGLHAVLIIHEGEVLAESYFPGEDQKWGTPLGERDHGPESLHDLRSVTKPVVGLLYGIALAEGKVPPVDARLVEAFPQYPDLAADPARQDILVGHALSMTMGTAWNENLPYSDPNNSEIAMEMADDRYRYVLDRPIVEGPGTGWTYSGGAVALIASVIADGVGMPIDEYADETLFGPLGITDYEWVRGSDGVPSAASGLRMNIHDVAKVGRLIVQHGAYDGRQVVPADWLKASFAPHAAVEGGLRYGYFWWLAGQGAPPAWVAGFGNGGQRLTVQPAIDLVVVIFAGNYNQPDDWRLPVRVIEEFVVPAVTARRKG